MTDFLFYLFSTVTLASALLVVLNRNAVDAAVFLIVTALGLASLFVLLEAFFLAVIQVLIYAGAVVVLFLFIIMLLDVQAGRRRSFGGLSAAAGIVALLLLIAAVFSLFGIERLPALDPATVPAPGADLKAYGYQLFTTYLLPVQVTGFLLLAAMLGVIVLSRTKGSEN